MVISDFGAPDIKGDSRRAESASRWSRHRPTQFSSCDCHAVVVRNDSGQIDAELLCGREMDRVQRPQFDGKHSPRGAQNPIIDSDEVDSGEDAIPALNGLDPQGQKCASNFSPGKSAGNERLAQSNVLS
jgi:hypothetical protein